MNMLSGYVNSKTAVCRSVNATSKDSGIKKSNKLPSLAKLFTLTEKKTLSKLF